MRRILLALTATAVVVTGTYVLRPTAVEPTPLPVVPVATSAPGISATPATALQSGPAAAQASTPTAKVPAELDRLIGVFEARTETSVDALDFRTLGSHYASRAAITGDIADYELSATAYERAYELAPNDAAGAVAYASALASLHQFGPALTVAESVLDEDPTNADALAAAGDTAAELGDLQRAGDYYASLEFAAPGNPAVLVRLAGLAHLTGNQEDAIALAAEAEDAAQRLGVKGKSLAFYRLLSSDLFLDAGRYDEALAAAHSALDLNQNYAISHASLGRALAHRGDLEAAVAAYETALAKQDDPGWHVALAELLTALDRADEAAPHFDAALDALIGQDEVLFGQSLANLYLDLEIEPVEALRLARSDVERRQSIDAYDTLAWALYRNGMLDEARAAADIATSTGAQDAGLLYHSAVISAALGETERAITELRELLDRNPGFHPLHSRTAAVLLADLERSDY